MNCSFVGNRIYTINILPCTSFYTSIQAYLHPYNSFPRHTLFSYLARTTHSGIPIWTIGVEKGVRLYLRGQIDQMEQIGCGWALPDRPGDTDPGIPEIQYLFRFSPQHEYNLRCMSAVEQFALTHSKQVKRANNNPSCRQPLNISSLIVLVHIISG